MNKFLLSLVFILLHNLNLQATDLLSESCNLGNKDACNSILNIAEIHYMNKDYPKAIPILSTFCKRKHIDSCTNLNEIGAAYYNGSDVEINYQKASQLFVVACEAGNGVSCDNIGVLYSEGIAFKIDQNKAMNFFSKACNLGHNSGCKSYEKLKNQSLPNTNINKWKDAGFIAKDAKHYIKNNISISEAKKWKDARFRAKDACYYINKKITLSEAIQRVK